MRALTLLDMQRNAMLMYTSCGWFFSELSGIETIQTMKYAGHAMDLMESLGIPAPRDRFLEVLGEAKSNLAEMGNGADVFRRFVPPCRVTPKRLAAHLAISRLAEQTERETWIGDYYCREEELRQREERTHRAFNQPGDDCEIPSSETAMSSTAPRSISAGLIFTARSARLRQPGIFNDGE